MSKTLRIHGRSADRRRRRYGGAAPCRRRAAHAADQLAGARRRDRRARVPEGRDAPAHRLVQVPRRLQQALLDPADKRAGGVVAFSSGNHAQGVAHAAKLLDMPSVIVMPRMRRAQARAHRRVRRARSCSTTARRKTARRIARAHRREARRDAGAAVRRSVHHRGPGHGRPRDHGRSDRARAEARHRGDRRVGRRPCGRHFARHQGARAGREDLHRRAGGLRRHRALVPSAASTSTTRACPARSAMR